MFTVTQVGSWPRSNKLLDALTDLQHDKLTREEFERVADDEIRRAVELQIEAGVDVVTDGEQRRDNFFSFVTDKLDGAKLMALADLAEHPHFERTLRRLGKLDVPPESIKNATCVGKLKRREPLAVHELKFVKNLTDKPVKVPLPGPYLLARSMWVEGFSDEPIPPTKSSQTTSSASCAKSSPSLRLPARSSCSSTSRYSPTWCSRPNQGKRNSSERPYPQPAVMRVKS